MQPAKKSALKWPLFAGAAGAALIALGLSFRWESAKSALVALWLSFPWESAQTEAPDDAIPIRVHSRKWTWVFEYPSGLSDGSILKVPAGKPVKLLIDTQDVDHGFYLPRYGINRRTVPGKESTAWFQANEPGESGPRPIVQGALRGHGDACGRDHRRG